MFHNWVIYVFETFFIRISFEVCGLKSSDLSFRSSRWRVFQNELWPNRLNQPSFIADQKVATLCRPRPFRDFGEKITSWDTKLAFSFAASPLLGGSCSPFINSQ